MVTSGPQTPIHIHVHTYACACEHTHTEKKFIHFLKIVLSVLPTYKSVHHIHTVPTEARGEHQISDISETGVPNCCEAPCGFWKLNLDSL